VNRIATSVTAHPKICQWNYQLIALAFSPVPADGAQAILRVKWCRAKAQ